MEKNKKKEIQLRCDVLEVQDYTDSCNKPDMFDIMKYAEDKLLCRNSEHRLKKIEEVVDAKLASLGSRELHNLKIAYKELKELSEKYDRYLHDTRYHGNEMLDCFLDKLTFPERQQLRIESMIHSFII